MYLRIRFLKSGESGLRDGRFGVVKERGCLLWGGIAFILHPSETRHSVESWSSVGIDDWFLSIIES
jgi:hypothetical protein